jgi:hypothetical protein
MVCYKVRARTKTDLTDYKWFVVRSVIRYVHVPRSVIRYMHVLHKLNRPSVIRYVHVPHRLNRPYMVFYKVCALT